MQPHFFAPPAGGHPSLWSTGQPVVVPHPQLRPAPRPLLSFWQPAVQSPHLPVRLCASASLPEVLQFASVGPQVIFDVTPPRGPLFDCGESATLFDSPQQETAFLEGENDQIDERTLRPAKSVPVGTTSRLTRLTGRIRRRTVDTISRYGSKARRWIWTTV